MSGDPLQHWISNNVFGLAFCLNAIEMISLDSVGVGALLLGGFFLYDIFWVRSPSVFLGLKVIVYTGVWD